MAGEIASRLKERGIVLPMLPTSCGNYLPAKRVGQMVYLAGVTSSGPAGGITRTLRLDRTIDDGYDAARA